jgi:HEAT repeat protein
MNSDEPMSFSDFMREIAAAERLELRLLFRLSDLTPEELVEFQAGWPAIDAERRRIITRHLADICEDNFQVDFSDVFAYCLTDETPAVRMAALDGLWDSERLALITPIIALMEGDPDDTVRALAAATLGHYVVLGEWEQIPAARTGPIVEALLAQLNDDQTPAAVRRAALESVGASSDLRVAPLIESHYRQGGPDMRLSAVFAMGRSADGRWAPIISTELDSDRTEMRIEAARAAGGLGDEAAVDQLAELLNDEDLEVQLAAVAALGQIGGQEAIELLELLLEEPQSEALYDAAEEALEEMMWLGGDVDLSLLDWDNSADDDLYRQA